MFVETEKRIAVEPAPVEVLKPSRFLRLGTMIRPQAKDEWFSDEKGDIRSCALGAMSEALFGDTDVRGDRLYEKFPLLEKENTGFACPVKDLDVRGTSLSHIITALNDRAGWSREKIADWLESRGL